MVQREWTQRGSSGCELSKTSRTLGDALYLVLDDALLRCGANGSTFSQSAHLRRTMFGRLGCDLSSQWVVCNVDFCCRQGLQLQKPEVMRYRAKCDWNRSSRPKLSTWLVHHRTDLDKMRLHSLGNVVFPRTAELGIQLMAQQTEV